MNENDKTKQTPLTNQNGKNEITKRFNNRANRSGQTFERHVYEALRQSDFFEIRGIKHVIDGQRQFIHSKPIGETIYGTTYHPDFVVFGLPKYLTGLIIEVRYQGIGGSVDQKFPFLISTIKKNKQYHAVIGYCGEGASKKSVEWAKTQQGSNLIGVCELNKVIDAILKW
jgi:hypothetical protein